MYQWGRGVTKDRGTARAWYLKADEHGYLGGKSRLGETYAEGQGDAQDYAKARAWYQKATENYLTKAQFSLALMYAMGEGRPKDYVQAFKWAALSAEHGKERALRFHEALGGKMTPAQLAEAKRLVAEWKQRKLWGATEQPPNNCKVSMTFRRERQNPSTTPFIPLKSGIHASFRYRLVSHYYPTNQTWQSGLGPGLRGMTFGIKLPFLFSLLRSCTPSLPLDRARRLRCNVIDDAIDALHLVDDARRRPP